MSIALPLVLWLLATPPGERNRVPPGSQAIPLSTTGAPLPPATTAPEAPALDEPTVPASSGLSPVAPRSGPARPSPTASPASGNTGSGVSYVPGSGLSFGRHLHVAGGAYLWLYEPVQDDTSTDLQLWAAYLVVDATTGDFALHLEPRVSPQKLRPFYRGKAWVQEAYAAYHHRFGQVKLGELYSRMGRSWDGSFYGNIPFFDGIALDPDLGISAEGDLGARRGPHLGYAAQLFLVDAHSNGALDGRDTIAVKGGHRRDQALLRVVPGWRFGEGRSLLLGLTAERFTAELPGLRSPVWRTEADLTFDLAPLELFGEVLHQNGRSLQAFPLTAAQAPPLGKSATRTDYTWAGAQLDLGHLVFRYTLSWVDYRDAGVREWLQLAGVTIPLSPYVDFFAELAVWRRSAGGRESFPDQSLNATLFAHF